MNSLQNYKVILYDGDCPFCNRMVTLLIRLDKKELLRYAALDSETAMRLLGKEYDAIIKEDSLVFHKNKKNQIRSQAVIEALEFINRRFWSRLLHAIPQNIRDWGYDMIARHRRRIYTSCPPIPASKRHLLLP